MALCSLNSLIHRPDYKDFFYAHQRDGIVKLTFPNEKEKSAYNFDPSQMKGLIIIFLSECDWGNCADGDLKAENITSGDVAMTVNDVAVNSVTDIGSGCTVLKHENGVHWKPSLNGDYEIGVDVNRANSYLRISSIVVY